jgi:alkanesulfonate monooxygenase SsuD/methylene tetrahydromethanopterin reductase-like flavin-dependent oxidoreductase (luciferase family)
VTPHDRPFRFGLLSAAGTAAEWQADVARAEGGGYSTVVLTDHLDLSGAHVTRLAWVPALADALARTTTLATSVMVANQDLRHPAVLARDVVTLDRLGAGRMELGLGAGWAADEYAWAGLPFDDALVRVRRLAEYAAVVRGLTTAAAPAVGDAVQTFDFAGEFFTISAMPVDPLPVRGRLPLMLGGSRPGVLSLAARVADVVNLNTLRDDGPADDVLAEKVAWVREAAGDRYRELELATSVALVAGGSGSPAAAVAAAAACDRFAHRVTARMPAEAAAGAAFTLAGTTEHLV